MNKHVTASIGTILTLSALIGLGYLVFRYAVVALCILFASMVFGLTYKIYQSFLED